MTSARCAGQGKTVRVVIQTAATATPPPQWDTWFGAYLNEGNQTGTNQDNFYSTGTITTSSAGCTGSADANYFLPNTNVSLSTPDGCGTAASVRA